MNLIDIRRTIKREYPVLMLERFFSWKNRDFSKKIFLVTALIGIFLMFFTKGFIGASGYSLALLSLSLFMIVFLLDAYYYSYYFSGLQFKQPEGPDKEKIEILFETSYLISITPIDDITGGFLGSRIGRRILYRLGISEAEIRDYADSVRDLIKTADINIEINILDIAGYSSLLFKYDKTFNIWLFKYGISEEILRGASLWVSNQMDDRRKERRWWSRDNLGTIPSIGRDWSYGGAYGLMRFGTMIQGSSNTTEGERGAFRKIELDKLETALIKTHASNAVLVGDEVSGSMDIVVALAQKIEEKTVLPQLQGIRIVLLDTDLLILENKDKIGLENSIRSMMNEAVMSGNIIVLIKDLISFIKSAGTLGTDVISVLSPYFDSNGIKFIILSTKDAYQATIRTVEQLKNKFEILEIEEAGDSTLIQILEEQAILIESRMNVFVTYIAIIELIKVSKRFFMDSTIEAKTINLLEDVCSMVFQAGRVAVFKSDVESIIREKTGIPIGAIDKQEKDKLLNLEKILQQRVVGQSDAIIAISNAMRRARSGISNPNRPVGSFLFIGPTGVGKTETSKALAQVFFEDEEKIMRIDMSEYNDPSSLNRLIGSTDSNQPGVLATMIRESEYGVLLLDEFEKTNQKVHDLFLQILDEGFFSDVHGKRVNARNLIIIATSNAGSSLIWKMMQDGTKLNENKKIIIDSIIENNIFKPELINRFDGVILFHPLSTDDLKKIVVIMLGKLQGRLKERGINLEINSDLVDYLVSIGGDKEFGARPLNRAIQEKIESLIAEKIIREEIASGSKIILLKAELDLL